MLKFRAWRHRKPEQVPLIFMPLQEWSCEACGWKAMAKMPGDLERNVADHLQSDWHRQNALES